MVLIIKSESPNTSYTMLYKHTFPFVNPRKMIDSKLFNIKYQNPEYINTTAERLRYYRYRKELLQKDVAEYANININTYINYESINRDYYPLDILKRIANLYEIDVTKLMDDYNLFLYHGQGKKLKELISSLKIPKKSIAKKLNVHAKTITAWEKEKVRMSKSTYIKIFKEKILN